MNRLLVLHNDIIDQAKALHDKISELREKVDSFYEPMRFGPHNLAPEEYDALFDLVYALEESGIVGDLESAASSLEQISKIRKMAESEDGP